MGWLWQRTQRTQKRVTSVAVGVQAGDQVTSDQGRDVALSSYHRGYHHGYHHGYHPAAVITQPRLTS